MIGNIPTLHTSSSSLYLCTFFFGNKLRLNKKINTGVYLKIHSVFQQNMSISVTDVSKIQWNALCFKSEFHLVSKEECVKKRMNIFHERNQK